MNSRNRYGEYQEECQAGNDHCQRYPDDRKTLAHRKSGAKRFNGAQPSVSQKRSMPSENDDKEAETNEGVDLNDLVEQKPSAE